MTPGAMRDDARLSAPDSKFGQLQRACLELLREHHRKGDIPTNGRFLFYELEQRGVIPKKYDGINPKTGNKFARTPLQDVSVATMHLRENGLIPWSWIEDESRQLDDWRYADTVIDYLIDTVPEARIDLWAGEPPPLLLFESRASAGVVRSHAYEYLTPITATGGQCGGFIVNEEQNTKRYIEKHAARIFGPDEWTKIALTEQQVNASVRLRRLAITKLDKRYKPPKEYEAIECEARGQGVLVRLIRHHLDSLLPEPLDIVRERERLQRERAHAALRRIRRRS